MAKNGKSITKEYKEENNEVYEMVTVAARELMLKKQENLPRYIRKRKKEFLKELEEYKLMNVNEDESVTILNKTLPMVEVSEHCFEPFIKSPGGIPSYSAEQLSIIFDYYKQCIKEMNKVELFPPTKEQFCQLCGISTNAFSSMKNGGDDKVTEVLLQVEDYIANWLNIGGLTRKTAEVTGIFIQKSSLGRKEATDIVQNTTNNTLIVSESEMAELMSKFTNK